MNGRKRRERDQMISRNQTRSEKLENGDEISSRKGTRANTKILGLKVLILRFNIYSENVACVTGKPCSFRS